MVDYPDVSDVVRIYSVIHGSRHPGKGKRGIQSVGEQRAGQEFQGDKLHPVFRGFAGW